MSVILVATDFSAPAERALAEAITLAQALAVPIEIMHVHVVGSMPIPPTLEIATRPPAPAEVARAEDALSERGRAVQAAGVACTTFASFGTPADEITRRAGEVKPRLLVVGTHGHSVMRHLLIGSTAERVVKHAACPVLVVPTPR